jgi:hypothetical protein
MVLSGWGAPCPLLLLTVFNKTFYIRGPFFLCVFALCAVACFGVFERAHAGFGITPPYLRSDRLTQGSVFTQKIIIVRGDPVEDLKAEITINAPGIEDWISTDKGMEFILPEGMSQVPINFTVRVPEDAAYERHQGHIRIRTSSPNPASGVSIALGAQLDLDLRVVDQILDFDVRRVQLDETEEPRRIAWLDFPGKINFTMAINNTGNAPVAPSRVEFDLYDKRGTTLLESVVSTNKISEVPEFQTVDVVAELPHRLPPGAYLVKYRVVHREDEVKKTGELTLSVLPAGTLEGYTGYGIMGLSLGDKLSLIVPTILLLLGIIAAIFLMRYRRNRASQMRDRGELGERGSVERPPMRRAPLRRAPAPRAPVRRAPAERPSSVVELKRRPPRV